MTRTRRSDLEQLAAIITHALACELGTPCTSTADVYAIEYAYGRPRLVRADGSVDVSPRLPAGELAQWMRAFVAGIDAERVAHQATEEVQTMKDKDQPRPETGVQGVLDIYRNWYDLRNLAGKPPRGSLSATVRLDDLPPSVRAAVLALINADQAKAAKSRPTQS